MKRTTVTLTFDHDLTDAEIHTLAVNACAQIDDPDPSVDIQTGEVDMTIETEMI